MTVAINSSFKIENDIPTFVGADRSGRKHVCLRLEDQKWKGEIKSENEISTALKVTGLPVQVNFSRLSDYQRLLNDAIISVRFNSVSVYPPGRGGMPIPFVGLMGGIAASLFTKEVFDFLLPIAGACGEAVLKFATKEGVKAFKAGVKNLPDFLKGAKANLKSGLSQTGNGIHTVLEGVRNEYKATTNVVIEDLERVTSHLSLEAKSIIRETNGVITTFSQEVQSSAAVIGKETQEVVGRVGREGRETIQTAEESVKSVIDQVFADAQDAMSSGEEAVKSVLKQGCDDIERILKEMTSTIEGSLTRLTDNLFENIKGVVVEAELSAGRLGHLLIEDTGREVRVTGSHLMTEMFKGVQTTIDVGGRQLSLVMHQFGERITSLVYQIPHLFVVAVEDAAERIFERVKRIFFNVSLEERLRARLVGYLNNPDQTIFDVLDRILASDDSQVNAQERASLYVALCEAVHLKVMRVDVLRLYYIVIGLAILKDRTLRGNCTIKNYTHLSWSLFTIKRAIRSQKEKNTLLLRRENALEYAYPVEVATGGPVELTIEDVQRELTEERLAWSQEKEELRNEIVELRHLNSLRITADLRRIENARQGEIDRQRQLDAVANTGFGFGG